MRKVNYKDVYENVGLLNGWNFSKLQVISEGETWDFYEEVVKLSTSSDILLDIGTGGGEKVLSFATNVQLLIGIDHSKEMIDVALSNLIISGLSNVRFFEMPAENLAFPQEFFNIVSCRQSGFDAKQVDKVLVNGGLFLTQQVSEDDKLNIKQAFGRGQDYGIQDGTYREKYTQDLSEAGFSEIKVFEYDAKEYYQSIEDIVFLLKYTPIIPNFGEETDFEILDKFISNNQTDKGILTNSKRYMIIAKK